MDNLNSEYIVTQHQQASTGCAQEMYTITLIYPSSTSYIVKDTVTHCASLNLYTQYHIQSYQPNHSTLLFDCDVVRLRAYFYLCADARFVPKMV